MSTRICGSISNGALKPVPAQVDVDDKQIGYDITAIAAGIDIFERKINRNDGIIGDEGLVPLYLGKDLIDEKLFNNWDEVETAVEQMGVTVGATADGPRKMFLTKLIESLRMATLLFRGGDAAFDVEPVAQLIRRNPQACIDQRQIIPAIGVIHTRASTQH